MCPKRLRITFRLPFPEPSEFRSRPVPHGISRRPKSVPAGEHCPRSLMGIGRLHRPDDEQYLKDDVENFSRLRFSAFSPFHVVAVRLVGRAAPYGGARRDPAECYDNYVRF